MSRPQTVVSSNQQRSIIAKYRKGDGLVVLSELFKFSTGVIRRVLKDNRVAIRGRGRPATA